MPALKELLDTRAKAFHEYKAIIDKADAEKRELTADDRGNLDRLDAELDKLGAEIDTKNSDERRRNRVADLDAKLKEEAPRQTKSLPPGEKPGLAGEDQSIEIIRPKLFRQPEKQILKLANGGREHQRNSTEYGAKFGEYLSSGREQLGLQTGSDPKGGYLAPMTFISELIKFLDDMVFMRQLCRTITMPGVVSLGVPSWDTDPGDADWTAEVPASDIAEDDTAAVGKRELIPHLLTKLVKLSRKLLNSDALIGVETLVAQRLAYKFAIAEEKAFLSGTGAQRPLGVFTAHADGITTARDTTAASTTVFTADELIDTLYSLKAAYQERATWIVHRNTIQRARKLKDGMGQYIWQPGLTGGAPSLLLNRPYVMSEYAPNTYTTGLYVAIVGDFQAYWIVDSLALEVQRLAELFSLRNQVGLIGRKETDGMPVLAEAFARLKLA